MTCNCICRCTNMANPSGEPPTMCADCQLMDELCSDGHQLPNPAVKVEHVEYQPTTDEMWSRLFDRMMSEQGF